MKSKLKQEKKNKNKSPKKSSEKEKKENNQEEIKEEIKEESKPRLQNIERYIYISSYSDIDLMSNLKQLFEEVNQTAFNFESENEIYSYNLSSQEQDNNELDYITGFQIIDKTIRITI